MVEEAAARGLDAANLKSQELIAAFARQVAVGVASAPEVPGAVEALAPGFGTRRGLHLFHDAA